MDHWWIGVYWLADPWVLSFLERKKIYLLVEYEPLLYPASELGIGITLVPSPEQAYSSPRHYREMEEMEDPRK